MVSLTHFKEKASYAIDLLGVKIASKTLQAIYDRIAHNFTDEDLSIAIEAIIDSEGKFSYNLLLKQLEIARSERLEREERDKKLQERMEAREFWRKNYTYIKEGICNRKCNSCHVVYCDILITHTFSAIREMLELMGKDAKQSDIEAIVDRLHQEFPDIGFREPF